jgi:hypothetical protein
MEEVKIITFPDQQPLKIIQKNKSFDKKISIENDFELNNNNFKPSKTSIFILNYITYLINNNLLPDLPNELKIAYINDNSFFSLDKNKELINAVSKEPFKGYSYPACMAPNSNTLYLSNDLELDSNLISNLWNSALNIVNPSKSNAVLNYRNIFNQDNKKAMEYLVGHELGHFFLQIKNKDKILLSKNNTLGTIALNIEEGFSESFALHIMCLRNKGIEIESNQFEKIKQYRVDNETHRLRFFKNNSTDKDINQYQEYFSQVGIDKLFNTYDFPLVYENIPFKDLNGNIEMDINKLYDKCYNLALDNNREAIKNFINNDKFRAYGLTQIFKEKLEKSLKISKDSKSIDIIINDLHKHIDLTSFTMNRILGFRNKFLHNNQNVSNLFQQIKPT